MVNRRERKKQQTRQLLVDAAISLFDEKGYEATTTEDISERADVSQRTFFRHFPVKEAVLYADMDDYINETESLVEEAEGDDIVEVVRSVIMKLAENYQTEDGYKMHHARLSHINTAILSHGGVVQTQWINSLTDAIAQKLNVSAYEDMFPGMLASVAVGALWVASTKWVSTEEKHDFVQLVKEAFALVEVKAI
jgi:AcrR family transcriptional regulator